MFNYNIEIIAVLGTTRQSRRWIYSRLFCSPWISQNESLLGNNGKNAGKFHLCMTDYPLYLFCGELFPKHFPLLQGYCKLISLLNGGTSPLWYETCERSRINQQSRLSTSEWNFDTESICFIPFWFARLRLEYEVLQKFVASQAWPAGKFKVAPGLYLENTFLVCS